MCGCCVRVRARVVDGDSSLVQRGTSLNRPVIRVRLSDGVRNRNKLRLWLWRLLVMADWNLTRFGLVPF